MYPISFVPVRMEKEAEKDLLKHILKEKEEKQGVSNFLHKG